MRTARSTLLIFSVIAATLGGCSAPFRTVVSLTRAELESRLFQRFPIEKRALIAKLTLDHPSLVLVPTSDRIGIECDAHADLVLTQYHGKVGVDGKLDYDPKTSTVYLIEPALTKLELPEVPEEHLPAIREAVSAALRTQLSRILLHQLSGAPERALVQSIDVQQGQVLVHIGL